MSISFDDVPSNLRAPATVAEFDNSRSAKGPAKKAFRALLIGQKTGAGSGSAGQIYRVTNADQVAVKAGRGSMLHRMAKGWFFSNKSTECWIGIVSDSSSGVTATGTLTVTGTAAADGTIYVYIGGVRVTVAVSASDSASTIASAIASAVGKRATGSVIFSQADAADNVTISGTLDGAAVSVTFVGTNGAVVAGEATYDIRVGDTTTATSFKAQVNAHAVASRLVKASIDGGTPTTVDLMAQTPGTDGNSIGLATTDDTDAHISGATLTGGTAGDDPDVAVYATVSSGVVTLHANNAGAVGNEIDVRLNYNDGEALPSGVAVAVSAMASGATNPTLTTLISALGDTWFDVIANPYTDSTSLTALETELSSRFGSMRAIDGMMFTAKNASYATVSALGDARNSPHSSIVFTDSSPTAPEEYAAHLAGVVAYHSPQDFARPLQTLALPYVLAPAESDRSTFEERNLLLYDGVSTTKVGAGSQVQIERLITTYQRNASGSPDESYLSVETMFTLSYLRYSGLARFKARYPRHKLAGNDAKFGAGQPVMTPNIGKAEWVSWFREMEELGYVEGGDQFKQDLVVERDGSDVNRLNSLLSPDIVNQLVVVAGKIQFKL